MKEATLDKALHLSISNETWVFSPDTLPSLIVDVRGGAVVDERGGLNQVLILKGGARGGRDQPG